MKLKKYLRHKVRRGYLFAYGPVGNADALWEITGERPKIICKATLHDYELRIQNLSEITTLKENPQNIIRSVWGDTFRSYTIVPKQGASVTGLVFRMSVKARHKLDRWELVQMDWYEKKFVQVHTQGLKAKTLKAETQILHAGQYAHTIAPKGRRAWLVPKAKFMTIARRRRLLDDKKS